MGRAGRGDVGRHGGGDGRGRAGAEAWVLASVAVALAGSGAAAAWRAPDVFAVAAPAVVVVLVAGWRVTGDGRLGWVLVFGAAFGLVELAVDWYHVARLRAFVYLDYGGLRVVASPWYMPLGWAGLVAQMGYGTLWIAERRGRGVAVAAAAAAGTAIPPLHEQFAAAAGAWYYPTARLRLLATPGWVVLGYGLTMALVAATVVALYRRDGWGRAVAGAAIAAAAMLPVGVALFEIVAT